MKYIFKSSEHKDRFADCGPIQLELAASIGMNRFDVDGVWIAVEGREHQRIRIPSHHTQIMTNFQAFCFEVTEGKQDLEEMHDEESRESKFNRLIEIIKGDTAERTGNGEIVISKDFTIKLISEPMDSDTVEAHIDGRHYQDMFTYEEIRAIHQAETAYNKRREKEFKERLFLSRSF